MSLENLIKIYGTRTVVRDVSIKVDQGEIVADGSTKKLINQYKGKVQLKLELLGSEKEKIELMQDEIENIKIKNIRNTKNGNSCIVEYDSKNDPKPIRTCSKNV